ncbi:uncharacterized protein SOCE26_097670 [Sorangium cellulosum]|uniref:Effector-associated domain-containing protein n=1 Tax=Sorangium cellulosum TaxID=56 RepID=A0A2L0F9G9_SORCE|nr:effector-associated domain EAD1-containing protein [Sorangium cellulosum]AUX48236.1 uncharacterized protein SOCE26_097670 [Sorangium cellulosum]
MGRKLSLFLSRPRRGLRRASAALVSAAVGLLEGGAATAQIAVRVTPGDVVVQQIEKGGNDVWFETSKGFYRLRAGEEMAQADPELGPEAYQMKVIGSDLWMSTSRGVFLARPANQDPIRILPADEVPEKNVQDIDIVACDGNVWLISRKRLYHVKGDHAERIQPPSSDSSFSFPKEKEECPRKIKQHFWLPGIRIDLENKKAEFISLFPSTGYLSAINAVPGLGPERRFSKVYHGPGGEIWVFDGLGSDIYRLHDDRLQAERLMSLSEPVSILDVKVIRDVAWLQAVKFVTEPFTMDHQVYVLPIGSVGASGARAVPLGTGTLIDTDGGPCAITREGAYSFDGSKKTSCFSGFDQGVQIYDAERVAGRLWLRTDRGAYRVEGNVPVHILKEDAHGLGIWNDPVDGYTWLLTSIGEVYRVDGTTPVKVWGAEDGLEQPALSSTRPERVISGLFSARLRSESDPSPAQWLSSAIAAETEGPTGRTLAPLLRMLLQLNARVFWTSEPNVSQSALESGALEGVDVIAATELDGRVWLGTKRGAFRFDSDLDLELTLRSRLWGDLWPTGATAADVGYVRAGEPLAVKSTPPAFFIREEDRSKKYFTPAEDFLFPLRPGRFQMTVLVRDEWQNVNRVHVRARVVPGPALALGALGALWAGFVALAVALAPYSRFFNGRVMSRAFRGAGSLGLVPLALGLSSGLRRHLLRRYRREVRANADLDPAHSGYVVPSDEFAPERFAAALEKHRRLLLLGQSGLGKTAYFRYLTFLYASGARGLPLQGTIPVLLPLGRYPGEDPEAIFHKQLQGYGLVSDQALCAYLLRQGGFILFIDGLNEVDEEARVQVNRFLDRHWNVNWMCVSSQEGYPLFSWMRRLQLAALDREHIAAILEKRLDPERAEATRRQFTEETYEVCRIPQDLEYVVALIERGEALPRSRHDLYTRVLAPVLASLDDRGHGDQKDTLFRRAYEMLRDRAPWIDREDDAVSSWLQGELVQKKLLVKIEADVPRYHFRHDLLRAYLAARWFAPRWRDVLAEDRGKVDSNWRSMLEFALLHLDSPDEARALLDALLAQDHRVASEVFNWADRSHQRLTAAWADDFKRSYGEALLRQAAVTDKALRRSSMLSGPQHEQLTGALLDAFPNLPRLTQMVKFKLGKNLGAITLAPDLKSIVFELISAAEAEGWTPELITAARESNPGNAALLAFAQQFGLTPTTPTRDVLERIIKDANGFVDVVTWRTRLGEIEGRVCQIEVPTTSGTLYGTGFLVGPGVIVTNHHVIEPVIQKAARPEDVVLRFDHKRLTDGRTMNVGKQYRLAKGEWLLDWSPPSPVDLERDPKSGLPAADQLDHALLRVGGEPGNDPVGGSGEPEAARRGWIEVPAPIPALTAATPLIIVQHPKGDPLKLAIDEIIGPNPNDTRLRYKTNTLGGSSGSPCFDINWRLVALHHSGDPAVVNPAYNEGIPLAAIVSLLRQRGKAHLLGAREA